MKKQISGSQLEQQNYVPPAIVHKGALKQFSGSPLGNDPVNPFDLPGQ